MWGPAVDGPASAARVDALVLGLWPDPAGTLLAAVGGYGREELFPYSDVDLLIVSERDDLRESIAPFLRGLWDAGLRVSQSVRKLAECLEVDDRNVELSVSLLDRRYLAGDRNLFEKLRDPKRERLAPKLAKLTRERHAKAGNTIYHLEPNVKETPGTLRDLHVLRWIARLEGSAVEAPGHELLFKIRTRLHEAAKRDQNVLDFEMQDRCAATLGFADAAALMQAYYREAAPIFRACLRRLDEVESRRSSLLSTFRDRAARLSNADFSVVGGRVYFRVSPRNAHLAMALFEFVARHGAPLARDAEDRLSRLEAAPATWSEMRRVLELPHAEMALRAMHDAGYLVGLFPELKGVESLVVRDFYHRYTVDEHTLVAIETGVKLRRDEKGQFAELARETQDYPLLLLALLFHDAGKGAGGENHAELSVGIAERAFTVLGVPGAETNTALFLIRHHLEMSRLMLTRDLSDPETAAALARTVGTTERLKLLTVMTYCDISAVHPGALTPWRTTLLWRLFLATARYLTQSLQREIASEGMPARYALTHTAEEMAEHRRMELERRKVRLERVGAAYRLTVGAADRPFLFADVAGTLAGFGMNILRAEAFINERHFAINSFTFADPMRALELNPSEFGRLQKLVESVVEGTKRVEEVLRARATPRRVATAAEPARVSAENDGSGRATLFEITAQDRAGLLFDVARFFSEAGCNIEVVLVDTEGRKAIDVFYVTRDGRQLEEAVAGDLQQRLLNIL